MNEQQWLKPNVEPIHLADGRVVETEVNGKAMDGRSGSVFVDGRDIKVRRNTSDEWEEVAKRYYLAIGDRNHADKLRDCKSDDLEMAEREAVEEFEKLQAAGNAPELLRVVDATTRIVERAITANNFARAKQRIIGQVIVSWAKQSYEPISTADDEMAAMERAGLLSGMRVDLISIEPIDDMWKARLAIAGGRFDIIVTFWLDDVHQLEENRLHIEDVEEAPGPDVSPLEKGNTL
ncbi:MAG TPA: hypothetical protein VFA10_30275 [Ktedonobacteraceae bacterium]|nr:hypothetical protein [Ktedonobacteraceae bacterium]